MRNIAEIIKDDKNGKQLSQTERQIALAYIQGKYDAVLELKDLSKRVENIEKQMKEDKEEQLKKLKAELDYVKYHCTL